MYYRERAARKDMEIPGRDATVDWVVREGLPDNVTS